MAAPLKHIFPLQNVHDVSADNTCSTNKAHALDKKFVLISGKKKILMTSLLQQAAVSYSVEGKHTVYIRPEPLNQLPLSIHGMYQMGHSTVQNIHYVYMDSAEELVTYLCNINNSEAQVPKAIIIDGLDFYISQLQFNSQVSICKLCSQLSDCVQYLNCRHCEMTPLLVSITDTLTPHLDVYGRYFDVYSLTREAGKNNPKHFQLEKLRTSARDTIYRYDLTLTDSVCLQSVQISHDQVECADRL